MSHTSKQVYIAHKINKQLGRFMPITTPLAVLAGFFFSGFFINFRPFVVLLFGVMTFSGALKLKAREMGNTMTRPVPLIVFFVSAHLIMPVIALLTSSLVFADKEIITGFILLFAGPAAVSGFVWILIFKADKALGLSIILLDTLLAPIVVPATLSVLLGKTVSLDMSGMAISLLFMVVVPTIIGVSINEASKGDIPDIISLYLDPFSKVCLMLVIAANASAVAGKINIFDPLVLKTAVVCIILIIIGFVCVYLLSVLIKCKGSKGLSMLFCGGLRNNSAIMTLAVSFFPEAAALPIIMSLLFQQTIAVFAGKIIKPRSKRSCAE